MTTPNTTPDTPSDPLEALGELTRRYGQICISRYQGETRDDECEIAIPGTRVTGTWPDVIFTAQRLLLP